MAIQFNHTILSARDSKASADFLAEMLGLPAPRRWGPFYMVTTENEANLDYMEIQGELARQHYAFLVGDAEFDAIFDRIRKRKLTYWADPARRKPSEIQRSRRRTRPLFRRAERASARNHHAPIRQWRLESLGHNAGGGTRRVTARCHNYGTGS